MGLGGSWLKPAEDYDRPGRAVGERKVSREHRGVPVWQGPSSDALAVERLPVRPCETGADV